MKKSMAVNFKNRVRDENSAFSNATRSQYDQSFGGKNTTVSSGAMLAMNESIKLNITYLIFVNWYDKNPTFRPSTLAIPLSHCGCCCI